MVDDDRLLDALRRALVPPEEPPPGRLNAFLRSIGRERVPSRVTPPKLGWLAAGASVVAAMAVVVVLALPGFLSPQETSPANVASTREAVARLRTALAGGDSIAVAEADANLLRVAGRLPAREAEQVRNDAVAAHTEAIVFLRDNPAPPGSDARPPDGETSVAAPAAPRATRSGVDAPASVAGSPPTTLSEVVATPPPAARRVEIGAVTADLDGNLRVEFTTSGFTPDPSRAPGTYAVRFSFDDGQSPSVWAGPSPWLFPVGDGLHHRQVCAEVVDHTGAAVPSSRSCRAIA